MDIPDFSTPFAKSLNASISGNLIPLFHSRIILDTPPVEIPISLEIKSLVFPLRYLCITSVLVGEFGIITYLIQYIMIKNLYKENGNSRRHFFDKRRQSSRHFRHFFRQSRHKRRHFSNPYKIEVCLSEAANIILIEVMYIQEELRLDLFDYISQYPSSLVSILRIFCFGQRYSCSDIEI